MAIRSGVLKRVLPARRWPAAILDALIPLRCGLCSEPAEAQLCAACLRELRRLPTFGEHRLPGVDFAWSAFEHSDLAQRLIGAAKYRARPGLLDLAIEEIATRLPSGLLESTTLVPVPPDPWRERRRGFDLAANLASGLATVTDCEVAAHLARRAARPQAGKDRAERLAASPRLRISVRAPLPRTLVLVDDVVTTGTTLRACAAAAREAGAIALGAVTLTRKTYLL